MQTFSRPWTWWNAARFPEGGPDGVSPSEAYALKRSRLRQRIDGDHRARDWWGR